MPNRRRLRQNGFTLAVALSLAWALLALVGLPPIGQAVEFWSGGVPTASSGIATVISMLWAAVALVVVYAVVKVVSGLGVGGHRVGSAGNDR
jgi:hypothetical protein